MRFVLLAHTGASATPWDDHFDLMLDVTRDAPLTTWRVMPRPQAPSGDPLNALLVWRRSGVGFGLRAIALPAHRRAYLTYEGEISGNRGSVRRLDSGPANVYTPSSAGRHVLALAGRRLRGRFLICPAPAPDSGLLIRRLR